jgi:hypothetical protein
MPWGLAALGAISWKHLVSARPQENVKATLEAIDVHRSWSAGFRTAENEPFYRQAFDYLTTVYGAPGDEPILDAGCGSGTKSIHLSARGYSDDS